MNFSNDSHVQVGEAVAIASLNLKSMTLYLPQHIFLWTFLWSEIKYVNQHKTTKKLEWGIFDIFKIALNIFIIASSVSSPDPRDIVYVETISFIVTLILQVWSLYKHISDVIFLTSFWTFHFLITILKHVNVSQIAWIKIFEISSLISMVFLNFLKYKDAEGGDEKSSESSSNFIRKIYFQWFNYLIDKGSNEELNEDNVWSLDETMKCENILKAFHKRKKKSPDYEGVANDNDQMVELSFYSLLEPFHKMFLGAGVMRLVLNALFFVCPYLLRLILNQDAPSSDGMNHFYVMMMFIVSLLIAFLNGQYFYYTSKIGLKIKSILMALIYEKSLKLKHSAGEDVTLISIDANRFVLLLPNLHMIWSGPITIIVSILALWYILGISALAGVVVMLLTIFMTAMITSKLKTLQGRQMIEKDSRLNLTNEVIGNIKHIKLYVWERFFENRVMKYRKQEINMLRQIIYYDALKYLVGIMAPFLVAVTSFALFVLIDDGNVLTLDSAFVSISIFYILKYPLSIMPMLITNLIAAKNAITRINQFLMNEESKLHHSQISDGDGNAVSIRDGVFAQHQKVILSQVNIQIKKGSFVAFIGMVGSGKSSLLSAILGEIDKIDGDVRISGKIAYAPQEPWILNQSLQENVTFGKSLDVDFYDKVIRACALDQDIQSLPNGHSTIIGEKGVTLSGGQKQRISLARAIYNEADIYLLDDPLSSVDSQVANFIYDQVFSGNGLLAKKTRIFVTQNGNFLNKVDEIMMLEEGVITAQGTLEELRSKCGRFAEIIHHNPQCSVAEDSFIWKQIQGKLEKPNPAKIENTRKGRVSSQTYLQYFAKIGILSSLCILIFSIANPVCEIFSTIWLSKWATAQFSNGTYTRWEYLQYYTYFGLAQTVCLFLKSIILTRSGLRVADLLHKILFKKTITQTMPFFDATPSGQIMNRFSNDVDVIDNRLANDARDFITTLFTVVSILVLFCLATESLIFILILLFIIVIYYVLLAFYLAASRQLKRLEASTKSPIISQFNESRNGRASIRAYHQQGRFFEEFCKKIDNHQRFSYFHCISGRWLGIRLELIGSVIIFFVTLLAIKNKDTIGMAYIGVIVSYALKLIPYLNQLVSLTALLEVNIISVERISQYLNEEGENYFSGVKQNWPTNGKIEFKHFSLKYSEDAYMLKDVSLVINGGQRIGIIGRTGAGKSSLINSLFRLYPQKKGFITIDDVDIDTLSLSQLRGSITVIPQNPVLFSGTIKTNLDPYNDFTEEDIRDVLVRCNLHNFVENLPHKIQTKVDEKGENMSVGQKQLICLARGLLKRSKIVILDEATSATDLETETIIQSVIKEKLCDCTVLTVAHRLNTVLHSDQILVMDNGSVNKYEQEDIKRK